MGVGRWYAVGFMGSVSLVVKFFALAFSALLPVINPLGSALVFLGVAGNAPGPVFRKLAFKVAIRSTLFLVIVELVGSALLEFFGISLPVVQVAGGLVLATIGWNLLNQAEPETSPEQAQVAVVSFESLQEKIFYPLTFPLTVGPGCIVVMLTLSAQASRKDVVEEVMTHLGIFLAVVVLSLLVFLCYGYAPKITEYISAQTAHGVLRVIAFVLLCIGVQITWNGVAALLKTVLKA